MYEHESVRKEMMAAKTLLILYSHCPDLGYWNQKVKEVGYRLLENSNAEDGYIAAADSIIQAGAILLALHTGHDDRDYWQNRVRKVIEAYGNEPDKDTML